MKKKFGSHDWLLGFLLLLMRFLAGSFKTNSPEPRPFYCHFTSVTVRIFGVFCAALLERRSLCDFLGREIDDTYTREWYVLSTKVLSARFSYSALQLRIPSCGKIYKIVIWSSKPPTIPADT